MKINLELNITGNDIFLNFWDSLEGKDVCGKVLESDYLKVNSKLLTLNQYITRIQNIMKKREENK